MNSASPAEPRNARVGSVDQCYQVFGDLSKPALLLVMGLSTQMLGWDEVFCAQLADRGFFVIRFDNRDREVDVARPRGGAERDGPVREDGDRAASQGAVHAGQHGARQRGPARRARHRAGARRGRVDGRHHDLPKTNVGKILRREMRDHVMKTKA